MIFLNVVTYKAIDYNSLSKDELIQLMRKKDQKIETLEDTLKDVKYDLDKKTNSSRDVVFYN